MSATERLARASAAHAGLVIGAWIVAVVVAVVLVVTSLGGLTSNAVVNGGSESQRAEALARRAFPPNRAERTRHISDVVVVSSLRGDRTSSPSFQAELRWLSARIHATGKALRVHAVVPSRGHAALIQLSVASDDEIAPIVAVVQAADGRRGFMTAITGDHTAGHDFAALSARDLQTGEFEIGLPAALVVLLLVFGAVVGALMPVLLAGVAIIIGLGIVALLSLEFTLSIFIVNMLTGMGLALGIDYSLFVISRYREERRAGAQVEHAIGRAGATASRAVLFSGSTFVVALVGMFLVPTSVMRSLASGAIIVGVVSVAAALSLLPALLGLLGDRVNALRMPGRGRRGAGGSESRAWRAIVKSVIARPALSLTLSVALLLAAATPIFGLHVGASGVASLPADLPSKQGYVALERYFPAANPFPVQIVVTGGGRATSNALRSFAQRLQADRRFGPATLRRSRALNVWMLSAPVRGDVNGRAAVAAVRALRREAHRTLGGRDASVYVGGHTAEQADYYAAATGPTPYVLVFVLGLSLILLTVAFRSVAIALISILLNLLSVGAAYGILTLVFINGIGASLLGFEHVPVIDAWVPLFLFSVLFGLSMDYQVFLLSRIKERHDQGATTQMAITSGVGSTARIITGAALIIIAVFAGFASGELVMFQQMGFGVAIALLLDATIIRTIVLPSTLALLGRHSWYLPQWLSWIPRLAIEDGSAETSELGV